MLLNYYQWHNLLKSDTGRPSRELENFERDMIELYGPKILNQWVRWSERLQRLGLYK
jgi:hypothetical protein